MSTASKRRSTPTRKPSSARKTNKRKKLNMDDLEVDGSKHVEILNEKVGVESNNIKVSIHAIGKGESVGEFEIEQSILTENSPYFASMVTNNLVKDHELTVAVPHPQNLKEVIVPWLKSVRDVEDIIDDKNAIETASNARYLGIIDLQTFLYRYIGQNLSEVSNESTFRSRNITMMDLDTIIYFCKSENSRRNIKEKPFQTLELILKWSDGIAKKDVPMVTAFLEKYLDSTSITSEVSYKIFRELFDKYVNQFQQFVSLRAFVRLIESTAQCTNCKQDVFFLASNEKSCPQLFHRSPMAGGVDASEIKWPCCGADQHSLGCEIAYQKHDFSDADNSDGL